jgi:hypothetical protein
MICNICESSSISKLNLDAHFFPTYSSIPEFHNYDNFYCDNCCIVFMSPQPTDEQLALFYNSDYRLSPYAITAENKVVDMPVQFPISTLSFQRFKSFYDIIKTVSHQRPDVIPKATDNVIDYGGYQGMFLYAFHQIFGSDCVVYDYNEKGIDFAKNSFGFSNSLVANNILEDSFDKRFKFVTLVQVLEHIKYPVQFLNHVHDNVITEDGYIYIEVPNLFGFPLSDPVHVFSYSIDSISYLLNKCGFEILNIYTDGYPSTNDLWDNNERKIVLIACKSDQITTPIPASISKKEIEGRMRLSYNKKSWGILGSEIKKILRQLITFLKDFVIFTLLEKFFPAKVTTIKQKIKSFFK